MNVFGDKVLSVRACVCLFGGDGIRGPDCGLWNRYVVSPVARRELQLARASTPRHISQESGHTDFENYTGARKMSVCCAHDDQAAVHVLSLTVRRDHHREESG